MQLSLLVLLHLRLPLLLLLLLRIRGTLVHSFTREFPAKMFFLFFEFQNKLITARQEHYEPHGSQGNDRRLFLHAAAGPWPL